VRDDVDQGEIIARSMQLGRVAERATRRGRSVVRDETAHQIVSVRPMGRSLPPRDPHRIGGSTGMRLRETRSRRRG
jgi:hypothetical protein